MRGILMRPSATSVWKEALAQVDGLPGCPSDLTEPQWAHLLFDAYCHVRNSNLSLSVRYHADTSYFRSSVPGLLSRLCYGSAG